MSKKKKVKIAIKKAVMKHYNDAGFTATADKMLKTFYNEIEKIYNK